MKRKSVCKLVQTGKICGKEQKTLDRDRPSHGRAFTSRFDFRLYGVISRKVVRDLHGSIAFGASPAKPVDGNRKDSPRHKVETKSVEGTLLVYVEMYSGTIGLRSRNDKDCGLRTLFKPSYVGELCRFRRM